MNKIPLFINKNSLLSARNLSLFASVCIASVSVVYWLAADRISQQITDATLHQFRSIAPHLSIDKALLNTVQYVSLDNYEVAHFQANDSNDVRVDFLRATTSKGYSGNITLLIGVSADKQTLLGVRTLSHKETPGLGDKIDDRISPWIHQFDHRSINDTVFAVDKDGGDFDAFTGATITPRAVTELVGDIAHAWQTHKTEPRPDHVPRQVLESRLNQAQNQRYAYEH